MSKRDEYIAKYAADLQEKCGISADMDLLRKITIACGPSIYNADSETVAGTDDEELARVKNGFMTKRLGVTDDGQASAALDAAIEKYGRSNRTKYRAVLYYILTTDMGKQGMFA